MKRVEKFYLFMIIIAQATFSSFAKRSERAEPVKQIKVGNFALPGSQQPGPLISFGQNILDRGHMEVFGLYDQFKGNQFNFQEVAPLFIYGLTDRLSLFIELPIAVNFQFQNFSSRGLQDFIVQLEQVLYLHGTLTTVNEITGVANIGIPTGSVNKSPMTGFGAPSFFLGFTASHAATDWYYFISSGLLIPTSHKKTKFGKQFLYQGGLGRNILYSPDKWIFNALLEFNGIYAQRSKFLGVIASNSGGNSILLGPSLWFSTQRLILQLGISGVIYQHLFGNQVKGKYVLAVDIGWTF